MKAPGILLLSAALSVAPTSALAGTDCGDKDDWESCICEKWAESYADWGVDASTCSNLFNVDEITDEFFEWVPKFMKTYKDDEEQHKRFINFVYNVVFMRFINGNGSFDFQLGMNDFSDLTPEEFLETRLGLDTGRISEASDVKRDEADAEKDRRLQSLPEDFDLVELGYINPPLDQGQTNMCWAFTAGAAIEGAWALQAEKLTGKHVQVQVSAQQIVDCTSGGTAAHGGVYWTAIDDIVNKNQHLCAATSYLYSGTDDRCKGWDHCDASAYIPDGILKGWKPVSQQLGIPALDQQMMQALYEHGPIPVGIDGLGSEFMSYASGVLEDSFGFKCNAGVTHAVTAVGYGTATSGVPYWNVKNSWGTNWGERGFFRMKRGGGQYRPAGQGMCGINYIPLIPLFTHDGTAASQAADVGATMGGGRTKAKDPEPQSPWTGYVFVALVAIPCLICCYFAFCKTGKDRSKREVETDSEDDDYDDEDA
jgi:hypothetical protein